MGKIASDSPVPFGEAEALRLAQLMTARAMNERRRESAGEIESVAESSARLSAAPWELLPQDFKPHAWQEACHKRWLELGRGTVKVATGGGKTRFALMAAQALQHSRVPDLRVAIIVPSVPLMYQWRDEILQGSVAQSDIALLGGGNATPDLASARIVIAVINSARERLPKLVEAAGWSGRLLLVVDECHRANAAQAQRVFDTNPAFTLGLSATPEQELEDDKLPPDEAYAQSAVGKALGPIIFEFSLRESVEAGLVTPFEIWHIGLPLSSDEAAEHRRLSDEISELRQALQAIHRRSRSSQNFIAWCQTQASKAGPAAADAQQFVGLANRRKRLLYAARSRVDAATALLREGLVDPEGRAIVFHEAIDETEALYAEACAIGLPAVLEHSKLPDSLRDENINLFRKGTARVIVSAKSLIEGFNVPSADLGVIAASTSSSRQRIQSLGRLLRRKQGGRTARIVVLYIRDTEDEAIYEKSDWASIVGAERNRYFECTPSATTDADWRSGLREVDRAPRAYKPPSHEVDVSGMEMGDPYPGQTNGVELRIDQQGNARDEASAIVRLPKQLVTEILARNELRRARITPAGHLIVRVDHESAQAQEWQFLGAVTLAFTQTSEDAIRLKIRQARGQRHITREPEKGSKEARFALDCAHGASTFADKTRQRLLEWVTTLESSHGTQVREICWDGETNYWVEVGGARIAFPDGAAKLEFRE
jgi:superfamily II DNA or RNA helicase